MQQKPAGGLRSFLLSPLGGILLVLLAVGLVFVVYAYVATVLAIPLFLIVGLGFPIYVGRKRPRFLALLGVVVLVAVAPLACLVFSQDLLVAPGAAASPGISPYENGGSVLQNATITPFSGTTSTVFTWTVAVYPKYLNSALNGTNWSDAYLELFISTCPGATGPNDSLCNGGYTLFVLNHSSFGPTAPANGSLTTFHDQIGTNGIWSWQMELVLQNKTDHSNPSVIELSGDATYNGLEGPIVGGYWTAYGALIGAMYEIDVIYLGIPFYFILVLYMWFKRREARHKEAVKRAAQAMAANAAAAAATGPAGAPPPSGPTPPAGAPVPPGRPPGGASELACPNCAAVVYPNEGTCWKCGSSLPGLGGTPLPSKG